MSRDSSCGSAEYLMALREKFVRHRVPGTGSFELTSCCNLGCIHCYLKDPEAEQTGELSTGQWLSIIDQITEAGCLNLLITGGEPLLHPGFADIYQHAKKKGLLVTLFTNGTLVNEAILDVFEDLPPQLIEISLYGATEKTYEAITGVPGSFNRCINNIRTIKQRHLNLGLKTVLLTRNRHELKQLRVMARDLGVPFRLDPAIFPRLNGAADPIALRVPAPEAVAIEFEDSGCLKDWKKFFSRMRDLPGDDRLFTCGAGLTSFHVDSSGNLVPCLMMREPVYNLLQGSFTKGWTEVIAGLRELKVHDDYQCSHCEKRFLCGLCPGFSKLEQGALEGLSPYLCSLGEERFKAVSAGPYSR